MFVGFFFCFFLGGGSLMFIQLFEFKKKDSVKNYLQNFHVFGYFVEICLFLCNDFVSFRILCGSHQVKPTGESLQPIRP